MTVSNYCPRCNAENRVGRRFCGACGAALPRRCEHCGFVNQAIERFCGGCGSVLEPQPATTSPPAENLSQDFGRTPSGHNLVRRSVELHVARCSTRSGGDPSHSWTVLRGSGQRGHAVRRCYRAAYRRQRHGRVRRSGGARRRPLSGGDGGRSDLSRGECGECRNRRRLVRSHRHCRRHCDGEQHGEHS